MTREEAIKTIAGLVGTLEFTPTQEEAFSMAIEALSVPQGDLISRADALQARPEYLNPICEFNKGWNAAIHECWENINALPSADAVSRKEYNELLRNKISFANATIPTFKVSEEAVSIHEDGTLEVKVPNAQKVGRVLVTDTDSHIGGGLFYPDDAEQGFRGGKIPPKEMLDGTVLIPKHQWLEMERELAELKEKFESADAVQGEWVNVNTTNPPRFYHMGECSICGAHGQISDNFCPNCGAIMESEKEYLDKTFPEHEGGEWLDITDMMTGESKDE